MIYYNNQTLNQNHYKFRLKINQFFLFLIKSPKGKKRKSAYILNIIPTIGINIIMIMIKIFEEFFNLIRNKIDELLFWNST